MQIPQKINLLKCRTQAHRALFDAVGPGCSGIKSIQTQQPNDFGRAPNIGLKGLRCVDGAREVAAHGGKELRNVFVLEPTTPRRERIGVYYRVGVKTLGRCGADGGLVGVEKRGGNLGVEPCIDDFICSAHHGIKIANVYSHLRIKQPSSEGEAGGIVPHHLRRGSFGAAVVAFQSQKRSAHTPYFRPHASHI